MLVAVDINSDAVCGFPRCFLLKLSTSFECLQKIDIIEVRMTIDINGSHFSVNERFLLLELLNQ